MTLLSAEKPGFLGMLNKKLENKRYAPLAEPSRAHLFRLFEILEGQKARLTLSSKDNDRIDIEIFDVNQPSGHTNNAVITVRQPVTDEIGRYIEIVLERGKEENGDTDKNCIVASTAVVEQVATVNGVPEFRLFGQLKRHDSITKDGHYDPFNYNYRYFINNHSSENRWVIGGEYFSEAITRAYLVLANNLFGIGEVRDLSDYQDLIKMFDNYEKIFKTN